MTATREDQLEHRIKELESVVASLIRCTHAAVERLGNDAGFGGNGGTGWGTWQRIGAGHQALTDLHGHLQRNPLPGQD